jgi:hypothetical protein
MDKPRFPMGTVKLDDGDENDGGGVSGALVPAKYGR